MAKTVEECIDKIEHVIDIVFDAILGIEDKNFDGFKVAELTRSYEKLIYQWRCLHRDLKQMKWERENP